MAEYQLPEIDASNFLPAGTVLQDRYRILEVIGQGGMGTVYKAEHLMLEKAVAIKCLLPEFARDQKVTRRFLREARSASAVGHEHIIDVVDFGHLDHGEVFMVTELLEGQDLRELINTRKQLPIDTAAHILCQVCSALAAAHGAGIIHRDLKPENIYLTHRRTNPYFVKILDFGLSKLVDASNKNSLATKQGAIVGTPFYMAPEQLGGRADIDLRADIYALGVTLFNMLTGKHPFEQESLTALILAVCTEEAPRLRHIRPDLPVELNEICARMLAKSPEDRYPNCKVLWRELIPFAEAKRREFHKRASQPEDDEWDMHPERGRKDRTSFTTSDTLYLPDEEDEDALESGVHLGTLESAPETTPRKDRTSFATGETLFSDTRDDDSDETDLSPSEIDPTQARRPHPRRAQPGNMDGSLRMESGVEDSTRTRSLDARSPAYWSSPETTANASSSETSEASEFERTLPSAKRHKPFVVIVALALLSLTAIGVIGSLVFGSSDASIEIETNLTSERDSNATTSIREGEAATPPAEVAPRTADEEANTVVPSDAVLTQVNTLPRDAVLYLGDEEVNNPFSDHLARGVAIQFRAEREGYQTETLDLQPTSRGLHTMTLTERPRPSDGQHRTTRRTRQRTSSRSAATSRSQQATSTAATTPPGTPPAAPPPAPAPEPAQAVQRPAPQPTSQPTPVPAPQPEPEPRRRTGPRGTLQIDL